MKTSKSILSRLFFTSLILISLTGNAQFTFVHLTDIHVSDGNSFVNNSDINGVVFSQMLNTVNNLNPLPAFVVASGDVTNVGNSGNGMYWVGTQYLFPSYLLNPGNGDFHIDSAQNIPIYFVPGNHEYYTTLIPPLSDQSLSNYQNFLAPANDYSISYNNAIVIFLFTGWDSFRPIWDDYNITCPEGSGLTGAQINWLRGTLINNSGMKKIIVMHHPPVNVNGTNTDGSPNTGTILDPADGSIINNRGAFLDVCDSFNVDIVLSGHIHQNVVADRPGNVVNENWTGGTRYVQTAACEYGGYRIITVDSSFVWVGQPQILQPLTTSFSSPVNENCTVQVIYNPTQQTITARSRGFSGESIASLVIYNLLGQPLYKQSLNISDSTPLVINASSFPKEFILFSLTIGDKKFVEKLILY